MDIWHDFPGPNAAYILELYERYREDPAAVDAATRAYFERWQPAELEPAGPEPAPGPAQALAAYDQVVGVARLARAIRGYGYLAAHLDPLGSPPPGDPELDPRYYGLTEASIAALPAGLVGGPWALDTANAGEALARLRSVYCGTIGYDYDHIHDPDERAWLREAA